MNIAGGPAHLGAGLFKSVTGVNVVALAYTSNAAGVTAVIGGEVLVLISDASELMPHVKSGKPRALAVTSAVPSAKTPGLPTVSASGLPGYESLGMTVILAPANTPVAVVTRRNREIVRHLNTAETKARFFSSGAQVVASSPERLGIVIQHDIAKWGRVIHGNATLREGR
jgi:tripartite-type tricarboxylate transporter receptor subunit TctC